MWDEWLPHYLSIGVDMYDFFHSTPKQLKAYDAGYELKRKIQDEQDWILGCYIYEAVSVVISNALRKKSQKPLSFRKKPVLQELSEKREAERPLSEEEKNVAIAQVFANLGNMQAKFEASKKKQR